MLIISTLLFAFAQRHPYRITVNWGGCKAVAPTVMTYLAGYYGDETVVYDSVCVKNGVSVFKGKDLPDGYYEAVIPIEWDRINNWPMVVSESRKFTYNTQSPGDFIGSDECRTYELAHFQINTEEGAGFFNKAFFDAQSYGHDLVYKYLLLEYMGLDSCTMPDARLLRHPLFNQLISNKLQSEKIEIIDSVFDRYGLDTEIGQYYIVKALKYYNMDNNVAYDDVLLHLYDKYYLPSNLQLFSENYERRLAKAVARKRHMAIGMEVPVIKSLNEEMKTESTSDISRKYTVVWFWDADCEDCLEETPILNRMYMDHTDEYDFDVFGYCITSDVDRWKKVSNEMNIQFVNTCDGLGGNGFDVIDYFNILTTPACILMDQHHKIIMRQFSLEELENFFIESISNQ